MIRPIIILLLVGVLGGYLLGQRQLTLEERIAQEATRRFEITRPEDLMQAKYLEVPQITVPVIRHGRAQAYLLVEVSIEASSSREEEALKFGMPRIQAAVRRSLAREIDAGTFSGNDVNMDALKMRVRNDLNALFPEAPRPPIEAVYFQTVLLQQNQV